MDKYIVLQSPTKLEEGQSPYSLRGFFNVDGSEIEFIPPTFVSEQARKLEWIIPDIPRNRSIIAQWYPSFNLLESGRELRKVPSASPKEPDVPAKQVTLEESVSSPIPTDPKEIKQLKARIMEKLQEIGVSYPKNSTLKTLRAILEKSQKEG